MYPNKHTGWVNPVKTSRGEPARILATDLKRPGHPLCVAVTGSNGEETVLILNEDGIIDYKDEGSYRIVNARVTYTVEMLTPFGQLSRCDYLGVWHWYERDLEWRLSAETRESWLENGRSGSRKLIISEEYAKDWKPEAFNYQPKTFL